MSDWRSTGRMQWGWFLIALAVLVLLPLGFDTYTMSLLLIWALFAMSLGLMWGYAGLLSFGHAAYFGLGAYTYAIAAVNIGESTVPLLLAILVPALFAAVVGAMMFYGRISDVYMGVITLVVTLILFKFMSATAGDAYVIGDARLGGFNGIPGFHTLNVPGYSADVARSACRRTTCARPPCSAAICFLPLDSGALVRPRAGRHPRERGALRADGLQRARAARRRSSRSAPRWRGWPGACSPTGPRS